MSAIGPILALLVAALLGVRSLLIIGGAAWHASRPKPAPSGPLPHLDVLVPAYNEVLVLEATVRRLLASDHPDLHVWIIDDGSTDGTPALARRLAETLPRVMAVCCPTNRGKAAALNTGLEHAPGPHIATVDADTHVATTALSLLAHRLDQAAVSAVAANVKVGNRDSWLTRMQSLEYITALQLDRRAQDVLGCVTTVPGAAAVFRGEAVRAVGGYSSETRTEDTDLTLALLRAGHRVVFEPRALAFTEAPATWRALFRQRLRWMAGFLQCLWKHRGAFFRPNALGWLGMPNLLYTNLLVFLLPLPLIWAALTAPVVSPWSLLVGVVTSVGVVQAGLAVWAVWLDREDPRDLPLVPVQLALWPWGLTVVAVVVWGRLAVGAGVPWYRPERRGLEP